MNCFYEFSAPTTHNKVARGSRTRSFGSHNTYRHMAFRWCHVQQSQKLLHRICARDGHFPLTKIGTVQVCQHPRESHYDQDPVIWFWGFVDANYLYGLTHTYTINIKLKKILCLFQNELADLALMKRIMEMLLRDGSNNQQQCKILVQSVFSCVRERSARATTNPIFKIATGKGLHTCQVCFQILLYGCNDL